ncbi:MAG: hypothetical protein WDN75_13055 [Bacteroidota bacterium]
MSKKKKQPQTVTPKKYIVTRARSLPIYKCLINKDWNSNGIASIIIMRNHSTGYITAGFYLVDLLARGVKDTHFMFNEPEWKIMESTSDRVDEDFMETPYVLVHNIIYGAVAFAEEHDMKPHGDFSITRHLLEEDTDDIELIDISFGIDGKPDYLFDINPDDPDEESEFLYDYDEFTDDDWREFLNSKEEVSDEENFAIMEALFNRWLDKYQPTEKETHADVLLKDIKVTNERLDAPYFKDEKENRDLEEIYLTINSPTISKEDLPPIEQRIHDVINRNPLNPIGYNYLATCAKLEENDAKYKAICESVIHRFPDYLFGKIMWINLLIDEQRIEQVPSFLNNHFHIYEQYPSRKTFHISEVQAFFGTMIRYFTKTGNLRLAQKYREATLMFLTDNESEPISPVLEKSIVEFTSLMGTKILEYLKEVEATD